MPDVYFYPRQTLLDDAFLFLRRHLHLKTALVAHVVMCLDPGMVRGTLGRTLIEADAVFGNSFYVTETTRPYRKDAGTIFNGINRRFYYPDASAEEKRSSESRRVTVLYAGSFQARKRPQLVIRQAARRPEVTFQLVGVGELQEECRSLADQLGCKNVFFSDHFLP